jgi:uncharacterized protein involved in exopolysaccharide biosynthesis/Mrp family chromosome partitioning ATPase
MTETISQFWPARVARRADPLPGGDEANLRELWLAGRRQRPVIALFGLLGLALGVFHYATSPKQYYSSAVVLIEERQNDLEQEISALRPLTRNDTGFENQMQILQSRRLAEDVVRRLGLQGRPDFLAPPVSVLGGLKDEAKARLRGLLPQPPDARPASAETGSSADAAVQAAAALLARDTSFGRVGRSYSVEIGYLSHDPVLARDIANAYAEAYLADGTRANVEESDRTADWMKERIEEIRQVASAATIDFERFRAENGAMDQQGLREREQRVEALNALYVAIEARYQEHLIAGSYPVPNGRILSAALLPERPSAPRAWQLLAAGLAAGLMLGLAVAVLRETREAGLRTARDVQAEGLAFLGYLPTFRKRRRPAPPPAPLPETDGAEAVFRTSYGRGLSEPRRQGPFASGASPAADAYATAAFRVLLSAEIAGETRGQGRVVGIGGLVAGDGATTLAEDLARQSAFAGRRTLLVDGDPGRALTQRLCGRDAEGRGAGDLWSGIVRLSSGLDLLPVPRMSGADAMRTSAIANTLSAARARYDVVLVDLPPVGFHPAAMALTRSLDGIVLVLRWGRTPRELLQAALSRDPDLRQRIAGVALNRTRIPRLRKYGVSRQECRALLLSPGG